MKATTSRNKNMISSKPMWREKQVRPCGRERTLKGAERETVELAAQGRNAASVVTINVDGLVSSAKRERLSNQVSLKSVLSSKGTPTNRSLKANNKDARQMKWKRNQ